MIGAACTLDSADLPVRLAQWRDVRSRAFRGEVIPGGIRLYFDRDESMSAIADLAEREAECCAFYAFALHVDGASRHLEISAGVDGAPAVMALLGMEG